MKGKMQELNSQIEQRKQMFGLFTCGLIGEDEAWQIEEGIDGEIDEDDEEFI